MVSVYPCDGSHHHTEIVMISDAYGANIRTNRMILLSNNITDNLFSDDERLKSLPSSGHRLVTSAVNGSPLSKILPTIPDRN